MPGLPIAQERWTLFDDKSFFLDPGVVAEAAEVNGILDYNPADYESQPMAIIISVDDIGMTRQNPARPMDKDATKSKYEEHSVAHFQGKDGECVFNGHGVAQTLGLVPCVMAFNGVPSGFPLVYFTDEARYMMTRLKRRFPSRSTRPSSTGITS
jgi:hypothetical protein